jgi:hypothetical protein
MRLILTGLTDRACREVGAHFVVSNLDEHSFAHRTSTQFFVGVAKLDGSRSFQINAQCTVMILFELNSLWAAHS